MEILIVGLPTYTDDLCAQRNPPSSRLRSAEKTDAENQSSGVIALLRPDTAQNRVIRGDRSCALPETGPRWGTLLTCYAVHAICKAPSRKLDRRCNMQFLISCILAAAKLQIVYLSNSRIQSRKLCDQSDGRLLLI
jgi:hypothetical protein